MARNYEKEHNSGMNGKKVRVDSSDNIFSNNKKLCSRYLKMKTHFIGNICQECYNKR
jgi:hypothetical protein